MFIKWGIYIGTTSGLALGIYMWFVELITEKKIYTLLMNVDFIPVIGSIEWPVFVEWLFHMIISWIIGILFCYIFMKKIKVTSKRQWGVALILSGMAASTYFPLTVLAIKETPEVTDVTAIIYWVIGHLLYAIVLKSSYYRT
ncbi:hypothetical protein GCM10010954_12820 [Halobacillus andaensis]|uniref:Uncharacterized protein n=1 Tax=Halobacillus andaensis TaxID=1176239 RepID=A0A917B1U7_HALAA|nr:hypothetical protein [Halobacillus andaensis]MBP2004078.1 exosortase/archaeosortase [Halobacillus andaensis]GGF15608.1 hypothetical protein GCM10010954_12820 [Halobacillus andaensis]